jgi:hypothetical protein
LSKRTRLWVGLGGAILACGVYVWIFGFQTAIALETRYMARKTPVVNKIPVELADTSVSHASGKKLSYFGYEFEIPWDDVDESKTRAVAKDMVVIAFRSGNALSVWSGPPREFVKIVLANSKVGPDAFRQIYGDEALQSDYALHRLVLETTPDKITPFVSRETAARQVVLILLKGISAPRGSDSGIFLVQAGEFKGFQYGHPPDSSGLSVELFADSGSLNFIFVQKANGPTAISQADINRVLRTLKKETATTPTAATLSN